MSASSKTLWHAYGRNGLVMTLGAMPLGAIGLATAVWLRVAGQRSDGVLETVGQAFLLVYVWGTLFAVPVSVVHTALMRWRARDSRGESVTLGLALGSCAGALSPTLLTGLLEPPAIAVGALVGAIYGAAVHQPQRPATI